MSSARVSQTKSPDNDQRVEPGIFDPLQVPVWQEATRNIQGGLIVPADRLTPQAVQQRFAMPPLWEPELRQERYPAQAAPRDAAVLLGLQWWQDPSRDGESILRVLLTQRTAHLRSHAGQIALPGGKIDAEDASAAAAALREAEEEVGVHPAGVEVLGQMPQYVTGTGYRITPVVALLPSELELIANPHEVADMFTVPLPFLMDPRHHRKHQWQPDSTHRREWFSMPYYDMAAGKERYIWGVTAGILRDFYRFMSA